MSEKNSPNGANTTYGRNVGTHGPCVRPTQFPCVRAEHPNRKSPRARFHDYSGGIYFITICTEDKEHYFGRVVEGEMQLSKIGNYTKIQLESIHTHYPYAELWHFVVMPNHIHAIIRIDDKMRSDASVDNQTDGVADTRTHGPCVPTVRTLLAVVVGGVKRAVTMHARRNGIDFGWQSRFHDHIVRNQYELNKISEYITNNPIVWGEDCFNK